MNPEEPEPDGRVCSGAQGAEGRRGDSFTLQVKVKKESFRNMVSLISTKFTLEGNSPLAVTSITMTDAAGNSVVVSLN